VGDVHVVVDLCPSADSSLRERTPIDIGEREYLNPVFEDDLPDMGDPQKLARDLLPNDPESGTSYVGVVADNHPAADLDAVPNPDKGTDPRTLSDGAGPHDAVGANTGARVDPRPRRDDGTGMNASLE
jgi:hypothetical protein